MRSMNDEQRSPLFLALDCGEIPVEQVPDYEHAPAYLRARAVWQAIYNQVMGQGGYISTRTMMNYGHFYCVAYAESVPYLVQLLVFHIMDRFRQQYSAYGSTFVQFPERVVQDLFEARAKAIREKNPQAYSISSTDIGELYETHQPRVMTRDTQGPTPIDPPFESIPLYYKKEPQAQPRKASKDKTFLERYLLALRLDYEREEATARKKLMSTAIVQKLAAVGQSMLEAGLSARKYRFAPSAMAMCHTLMQGTQGTTIRDLPQTATLIEFMETIEPGVPHVDPVAGLFFMQPFREYNQWVAQKQEQRSRVFGTFSTTDLAHLWTLNVLAEDGGSIFNLIYDSNRQAWRVPEVRTCLSGQCKELMSPEEMLAQGAFTNWELCPVCQQMMDEFSHMLPIALLMVAGEFAEESEPVERVITETITHKEKRPGSGKYDEKKEQMQFRIVSFDACFHRPAHSGGEKREPGQGPSWMELALKEGALAHVKRGFGKSTRHLDPARNPRWKAKRDVTVRGYEKRIPMRVENLQRLITKVVASKYEVKEQDDEHVPTL